MTIVGAGTGNTEQVPDAFDGANLTQTTARIAIDCSKASRHYCKLILESEFGQKQVRQNIKGGAQPGLNCGDLENFLIPLPPTLAEQKAISNILAAFERAIECHESLVNLKERRKHSLMQQLFSGEKRLPGFTEEWQDVRLGDFLTESRVSGSTGDTARKLTVRWYGNGVVPKKDALAVGSQNTRYYRRKAGQLIYSKLDLIRGAVAILPSEYDGWETTLDLPAFDISDAVSPDWLSQLVSWPNFTRKFKDFEQGGRKAARIAPRDFCRVFVAFPPIEEQRRIAEILNACDREIALHRRQLAAIREQKHGLMQKLLTGEVRVKV